MVPQLHRKNMSKIWAANIQNPDKLINTLFALPLPRPFSNEHCSGNRLTYLLPKSYQRLLRSYLSTANLQLHYYNYVVAIQLTLEVNAYCSCTACSNAYLVLNFCWYYVCDTAALTRPFRDQNPTVADTGQSNNMNTRTALKSCCYTRDTVYCKKK